LGVTNNRSYIMDDQQALTIISALANGAHPVTGELFSADSPYQTPDVVRALFTAQRALEARQPGRSQRTSSAESRASSTTSTNAGKPWSNEEDKQLLAAFDADTSLADLARRHGRTINGVRARLEKHGRMEPSTAEWPAVVGSLARAIRFACSKAGLAFRATISNLPRRPPASTLSGSAKEQWRCAGSDFDQAVCGRQSVFCDHESGGRRRLSIIGMGARR
jgi:hypothetical protein